MHPYLTRFGFQGSSEYLEDPPARIDALVLYHLDVTPLSSSLGTFSDLLLAFAKPLPPVFMFYSRVLLSDFV